MAKENYEVVIGLEIHAQLKTESKMFCRCSNKIAVTSGDRGLALEEPNTRVCNVCLGMPGSLPVANKKAVEWTLLLGLALGAEIPEEFNFERKNYFYPDLPKAYQISSATNPPVIGGSLEVETNKGIKEVRLNHIHLEEDAGKLIHTDDDYSLVDLNRAGTPLMEIVTEPDISSPEEAKVFLQSLRGILRYLQVSDADMEKGQMRCDANISLKKKGAKELGTKVEIKNINSFKMVERAIEYEIERQSDILDDKKKVLQETRGWNDAKGKSISQRSKEEAMDYRYFADPDLPIVLLSKEKGDIDTKELESLIPELPKEKRVRFVKEYGLIEKDAFTLTSDHDLANYLERTVEEIESTDKNSETKRKMAKKASNWILNELLGKLNVNGESIVETKILPQHLAKMIELIEKGDISGKMAKEVFDEMFDTGKEPESIVEEKGLSQISGEDELEGIIKDILKNNEASVEDYKKGKMNAIGFLVGQVMKETKGKANPKIVNEILKKHLS